MKHFPRTCDQQHCCPLYISFKWTWKLLKWNIYSTDTMNLCNIKKWLIVTCLALRTTNFWTSWFLICPCPTFPWRKSALCIILTAVQTIFGSSPYHLYINPIFPVFAVNSTTTPKMVPCSTTHAVLCISDAPTFFLMQLHHLLKWYSQLSKTLHLVSGIVWLSLEQAPL